MTGLFGGGGGQQAVYVPQEPQQAQQDSKKGATDLEKLQGQAERRKAYGQSTQFRPDNYLSGTSGDTTLSSGSLLALGGNLG